MDVEMIGNEQWLTAAMVVSGAGALLLILWSGVRIVPQSELFVVERFGRFLRVLPAGLNLIVPLLDRVRHQVSILERQLEEMTVSVITKDNVEISLRATVFLRVESPERAMYRIDNVENAVRTTGIGLIRNASGSLELDDIQRGRDAIATEVKKHLAESAATWGIDITRVEIMDVIVDKETKAAQRRQVLAERERRATVMEAKGVREGTVLRAEGDRKAVELAADAALYQARKEAEAVRITAEAQAYEVTKRAEAQAEELKMVGAMMAKNGESAARFEVAKRQVQAIGELAAAPGNRVILLPTKAVEALGAVEALRGLLEPSQKPQTDA